MDQYHEFYIDRRNGTFADELVMFGFARVVSDLLHEQEAGRGQLTIYDRGGYYQLVCDPPLMAETIEQYAGDIVYMEALKTSWVEDKIPEGMPFVDYDKEKERTDTYFEARRKTAKGDDIGVDEPHRYWDIFRAINPSAIQGYASLVADWWNAREGWAEVTQMLCEMFSQTPNPVAWAEERWKEIDKEYGWDVSYNATGQQIYNPDQGKGQNRSKLGVSIGNVSNFWLLEWLKAIGFYEAAFTKSVRGHKDQKTFVVVPRELSFGEHANIMVNFRQAMRTSQTHRKFDILAAIRYTQQLLAHFKDNPNKLQRRHNVRKDLVAGFRTAFYLDMGNAVAIMNISFIGLPGWIQIDSPSDIQNYEEALDELERLVSQFDESHSDVYTLLQFLRDFISGDDLRAFFRFTSAYPAYLMGRRERGQYAYPYTTTLIERLIMSTEKRFTLILETPGFQNVAYAIRQSTVTAQYRKSQGDRKYDVRYGLGQELARKARYADDFIATLSDFMFKYNAENAQVMETRSGPYRRSLNTNDIEDIVALIDAYGSETVANLLIAYGYARVAREESEEDAFAENA